MSDEQLRELDRRWRESGAVEDQAVLLLARLRAGHMTVRRLELAAGLGSAGAVRAATAQRNPLPSEPPDDLSAEGKAAWEKLRGSLNAEGYFPLDFDGLDREAALRSAVVALAPTVDAFAADLPGWLDDPQDAVPETHQIGTVIGPELRAALRACQEHCLRPSPKSEAALRSLTATLQGRVTSLAQQGGGEWQDNWLATCLIGVTDALAMTGAALLAKDAPGETFVSEVTESALSAWENDDEQFGSLRQAVLEAQRAALVPWILSGGDATRE